MVKYGWNYWGGRGRGFKSRHSDQTMSSRTQPFEAVVVKGKLGIITKLKDDSWRVVLYPYNGQQIALTTVFREHQVSCDTPSDWGSNHSWRKPISHCGKNVPVSCCTGCNCGMKEIDNSLLTIISDSEFKRAWVLFFLSFTVFVSVPQCLNVFLAAPLMWTSFSTRSTSDLT